MADNASCLFEELIRKNKGKHSAPPDANLQQDGPEQERAVILTLLSKQVGRRTQLLFKANGAEGAGPWLPAARAAEQLG